MNVQSSTQDPWYTRRLLSLQGVWWKRIIDVQAPYRWNLQRLKLGFTLEIGCGIGRNLLHLAGKGIGVDHNPDTVAVARARGLRAFTPADFAASEYFCENSFDSLLFAHLLEHLTEADSSAIVRDHLWLLKPGGRIVMITPQEKGFSSDPTHLTFVDFQKLGQLAEALHLIPVAQYSFPFPRIFGRFFTHNEFVFVCAKVVS